MVFMNGVLERGSPPTRKWADLPHDGNGGHEEISSTPTRKSAVPPRGNQQYPHEGMSAGKYPT